MKSAIVAGAGGFIGTHLVKRLKSEGYWVRGVDLKYPEFSATQADEFIIFDLRIPANYQIFTHGPSHLDFDECYQLAADMGGAGYVFTGDHDADIIHNSLQINLNVCEALKETKTKVFFSSSACMYPEHLQRAEFENRALKESDAYPANPDSDYGWEKLMSERLYQAYARNYGLDIRIARFHNIYGPEGTYKGGKEKAPAAICRKVIETKPPEKNNVHFGKLGSGTIWIKSEISIWGDGEQTRSFLYIDDCIDAVRLLMEPDFKEPINVGSEEMVSINDLAKIAIEFSGKEILINNIDGPTGVHGRNSDNTLIRSVLGWEPKYSLKEGLKLTYDWISSRYK